MLYRYRKQAGFSFVEMIVVIIIIALVFSLLVPAGVAVINQEKVRTTEANLDRLEKAILDYYEDNGSFPGRSFTFFGFFIFIANISFLEVRPPNSPNWQGPYVRKNIRNSEDFQERQKTNAIRFDSFGNAYTFRVTSTERVGFSNIPVEFTISSPGPNGISNDQDDFERRINVKNFWLSKTRRELKKINEAIIKYNQIVIEDHMQVALANQAIEQYEKLVDNGDASGPAPPRQELQQETLQEVTSGKTGSNRMTALLNALIGEGALQVKDGAEKQDLVSDEWGTPYIFNRNIVVSNFNQ